MVRFSIRHGVTVINSTDDNDRVEVRFESGNNPATLIIAPAAKVNMVRVVDGKHVSICNEGSISEMELSENVFVEVYGSHSPKTAKIYNKPCQGSKLIIDTKDGNQPVIETINLEA